jgi:phosphoglycolate phosphatase-like HAD superfamily hydrolase
MRMLALDFDGVISDSAPESFAMALRTYAAFRSGTTLSRWAPAVAGGKAPPLARIRSVPAYPLFLELMPLGNRAEDYAVVLAAIDAGRRIPDQAAYDAFRAEQDEGWLADFHRRFYLERDVLAEADPAGWRALMAPYPPIIELLRRRAPDTTLAIATSKDRRSVWALLRLYGIDDLFQEAGVLDKQGGVSKQAHVRQLAQHFEVELAEVTFLDDKLNHLDVVSQLGTRCGLAAWGYNGEREIQQARKRGHLVCQLADVERQLFG